MSNVKFEKFVQNSISVTHTQFSLVEVIFSQPKLFSFYLFPFGMVQVDSNQTRNLFLLFLGNRAKGINYRMTKYCTRLHFTNLTRVQCVLECVHAINCDHDQHSTVQRRIVKGLGRQARCYKLLHTQRVVVSPQGDPVIPRLRRCLHQILRQCMGFICSDNIRLILDLL